MDARSARWVIGITAVVLICSLAAAGNAADSLPRLAGTELSDLTGQKHTIGAPASAKVYVLVFLGTECPVSNGYAPTLSRLYAAHAGKDVRFLGVHCDADVSREIALEHAREYQLTFPLVLDHAQRLAQASGVNTVPTAVVLGADGRVLYRGRIDNRYVSSGVRRPEATVFDLQSAIESVLKGEQPHPATNEPFGCPLPPPRRE